MDTTLYVALSHQTAMRRHIDVVANNLANMNTTAFRKESVMFQEFLMDMTETPGRGGKNVAYVQDYGLARHLTNGQLIPTSNPLDLALSGPGYFAVETDDGEVLYSRNGHMKMSDDGFLISDSGGRFLDVDGNPVAIGAEDTDLTIASDGTITSKARQIGRINIVEFENAQSMKKVGDSMYRTDEEALPAEKTSLIQGMIEGSNVNPIEEMTTMINIMRSYQAVSKAMDDYQELRNRAINRLGRIQ